MTSGRGEGHLISTRSGNESERHQEEHQQIHQEEYNDTRGTPTRGNRGSHQEKTLHKEETRDAATTECL